MISLLVSQFQQSARSKLVGGQSITTSPFHTAMPVSFQLLGASTAGTALSCHRKARDGLSIHMEMIREAEEPLDRGVLAMRGANTTLRPEC